jgi:type IV pilus assembly protein PilN
MVIKNLERDRNMVQINLLPWREQARKEKKMLFGITLAIFVGITLFFAVLIHLYFASAMSHEKARIAFLQSVLGERQGEFNKLKLEKQKKETIESDLLFLTALRNKSFRTVQLMNELINVVPLTVTIEKLTKENDHIILIGKAQSELQITLLMKNITKAGFFEHPVLTRITENPEKTETERVFELQVQQKNGAQLQ